MLNFKHLRYFWAVAKRGGVVNASEYLHVTPQTISSQIQTLETQLGHKLFKKQGRQLQLTEIGMLVMSYAEEIFTLGGELEERVRHAETDQAITLRVGVADAIPKSIASRVLMPALSLEENVRYVCKENGLDNLLADLALHRLDMVLSDGPIPAGLGIRGFNHYLGESGLSFLATQSVIDQLPGDFPGCLNGAPMLIPSDVSQIHSPLLQWFEQNQVHPRIVGEFDDSALMKAFGHNSVGVFTVPSAIAQEVMAQYGVEKLGSTEEVREVFYIIANDRRLSNPAVLRIIEAARGWLNFEPVDDINYVDE
jgi:LysR family transcriptional activator of nhaA